MTKQAPILLVLQTHLFLQREVIPAPGKKVKLSLLVERFNQGPLKKISGRALRTALEALGLTLGISKHQLFIGNYRLRGPVEPDAPLFLRAGRLVSR